MKTKGFAVLLIAVLASCFILSFAAAESGGECPSQTAIEENGGRHRYVYSGQEDSCSGSGYIQYTCVYCGASYREATAPIDHAWVATGRQAATCLASGLVQYTCSRCGATKSETLAPLGHDYKVIGYKEATCEAAGWEEYVCTRCQDTHRKGTAPLGHVFTSWKVATPGTCMQEEILKHTCSRCNKTVEKKNGLGPHVWGEWRVIRKPVGEEAGLRQRECTLCHTLEEETIYAESVSEPSAPVPAQQEETIVREPLTLYAAAQYPRDGYDLDMIGMTDYIPYLLTVINSGLKDCMVSGFSVSVQGAETSYPLEPQLLSPGQSLSFVYSHRFSRNDLTALPEGESGLGYAVISFHTYGCDTENSEETFSSNDAWLSHLITGQETAFSAVQEPTAAYVLLSLTSEAQDAPFHAGDEIRYAIALTNQSNHALESVTLHLFSGDTDEKARYAVTVYGVEPGQAKMAECFYCVTEKDENRGFVFLFPSASWIDPTSDALITCRALPWTASAEKTDTYSSAKAPALIVKTTTIPQNGEYFTNDEQIVFSAEFSNETDDVIKNLSLETILSSGNRQVWTVSPLLAPGASETVVIPYTVTPMDASSGGVSILALARYAGAQGNEILIAENSEKALCAPADQAPGLTVTLRQVNEPLDGTAFRFGETIAYEIQVTNASAASAYQVQLLTNLAEYDSSLLDETEEIKPGETFAAAFEHTVTPEEAQTGSVDVSTFAVYETEDGAWRYAEAENAVFSLTRIDVAAEFASLLLPLDTEEDDACFRTLTVKGTGASEYTRHYCARHAAIVKLAQSLTEQAEDTAAGWQQAARLWEDEMEALCQQYLETGRGTARTAILKEKLAFLQYCTDYEAVLLLSGTPEHAAKKTAEMLINRVFDLCDGLHHAGMPRQDSTVTGSYASIITTGAFDRCGSISMTSQSDDAYYREQLCTIHQELEETADQLLASSKGQLAGWDSVISLRRAGWLAEMNQFASENAEAQAALLRLTASAESYVSARSAVLSLLYPHSPQTVQEVLSQLLKEMTVTLCQDMP